MPLVLVGPPPFQGGKRIQDGVGLVDLMPTLLDQAGLPPLPGVDGRSFLPLVRGEDLPCRAVLSEERLRPENVRRDVDGLVLSARTPEWKYVIHYDLLTNTVREQAFDLANDPEEQLDLANEDGVLETELPFGTCLCRALSTLRDQVWAEHAAAGETPAPLASDPEPRPPPQPCEGERH